MFLLRHNKSSTWWQLVLLGLGGLPRFYWIAKGNMFIVLRLFWPVFLSTLWGFSGVVKTSFMRCGISWKLP